MVSLDSRFEGPYGEIDCPNVDDEFNRFTAGKFERVDTLLFGIKLGLIDELRLMVNPVVLGKGKPFSQG